MDIVVGRKYVRTALYECLEGGESNTIFLGQVITVTEILNDEVVFFKKPVKGSRKIGDGVIGVEEFIDVFSPLIQMEENE